MRDFPLAWDAVLKETKVELELLADREKLDLFEKGIRCGVSTIMHRYGKANNKYMGKDFFRDEIEVFSVPRCE